MPRSRVLRAARLRQGLVLLLPAFLLVLATGVAADVPQQRENRIKAALIFKLVKFVEWPATALAGRDALQICALGDSPVGESLAAADGKPVRDRVAHYRRIDGLSPNDARGCHVLYVPAGAPEIGSGMPVSLRGRSVLTVSDGQDFARRGGMVGLVRSENRITFEINLRNAREAGLDPGAPLLELATVVE
jgi:hypothetical protein